jgi:hypothetical protein
VSPSGWKFSAAKKEVSMKRAVLFCVLVSLFAFSLSKVTAQQEKQTAPKDPISGVWEIKLTITEIKLADGQLASVAKTPDPLPITLKLDGDKVSVVSPNGTLSSNVGSWDGNNLILKFEKQNNMALVNATLRDNKLVGNWESQQNGVRMSAKFEGQRKGSLEQSPSQTSTNANANVTTQSQKHPSSTPSPTITKPPAIEGKVFRSDTNEAMVDVEVELTDENAPKEQSKVGSINTDKNGKYLFADVKPGKYSLVVTAKYMDDSNLPCRPSGMLATNPDKLIVTVAPTQYGTIVEIILVPDFAIGKEDVIQRNIDLKCGN